MALPAYATGSERAARVALWVFSVAVLVFLIAPILVVIPLSFNSEPFFTFPLAGFSLRWYIDFFTSDRWVSAIWNSLIVGVATTLLATLLGTVAAKRPVAAGDAVARRDR